IGIDADVADSFRSWDVRLVPHVSRIANGSGLPRGRRRERGTVAARKLAKFLGNAVELPESVSQGSPALSSRPRPGRRRSPGGPGPRGARRAPRESGALLFR